MATATKNIVTLPASEAQAVLGDYKVTLSQTWEGREGPGYNATLKRGSKIVADVEQEGRGGMTFINFRFNHEADLTAERKRIAKEKQLWADFVALWDFPAFQGFNGDDIAHDEETVIDVMVGEAIDLKRLKRVQNVLLRRGNEEFRFKAAKYGVHVKKGDTTFPYLINSLQSGDRVWNGAEWVKIP